MIWRRRNLCPIVRVICGPRNQYPHLVDEEIDTPSMSPQSTLHRWLLSRESLQSRFRLSGPFSGVPVFGVRGPNAVPGFDELEPAV